MLANNKVNIRLGFGHIRPFISNDLHSCRATVDYIPKAHSKLPFNYAPVSWDIIDLNSFAICRVKQSNSTPTFPAMWTLELNRKPVENVNT